MLVTSAVHHAELGRIHHPEIHQVVQSPMVKPACLVGYPVPMIAQRKLGKLPA